MDYASKEWIVQVFLRLLSLAVLFLFVFAIGYSGKIDGRDGYAMVLDTIDNLAGTAHVSDTLPNKLTTISDCVQYGHNK